MKAALTSQLVCSQVHAPDRNSTKAGIPLSLAASHVVHTGQIFFPEPLLTELEGLAPYSNDPVKRTHNQDDGIFRQVNPPLNHPPYPAQHSLLHACT